MSNTVEFYPEVLKTTKEVKRLCSIYDLEIDVLQKQIERIVDNAYVESIDEYGAARFENIFSLYKDEKDSLDVRRFRILSKFNRKLPYTLTGLKRQLDVLCGNTGYDLKIDYVNCVMIIDFIGQDFENIRTVKSIISEMIPMNLLFKVSDKHTINHDVVIWNKACTKYMLDIMSRRGTELALLNGKWFLDENIQLEGYRGEKINLYPTTAKIITKTNIQNECEIVLRKEKDLWYLNGNEHLDGNRAINASIIYIEL